MNVNEYNMLMKAIMSKKPIILKGRMGIGKSYLMGEFIDKACLIPERFLVFEKYEGITSNVSESISDNIKGIYTDGEEFGIETINKEIEEYKPTCVVIDEATMGLAKKLLKLYSEDSEENISFIFIIQDPNQDPDFKDFLNVISECICITKTDFEEFSCSVYGNYPDNESYSKMLEKSLEVFNPLDEPESLAKALGKSVEPFLQYKEEMKGSEEAINLYNFTRWAERKLKANARFLVESYRTALLGTTNESPEQFLLRMNVGTEEAIFVIPYLESTRNWYDECADLFDQLKDSIDLE